MVGPGPTPQSNKGVEDTLETLTTNLETLTTNVARLHKPSWQFWLPFFHVHPCSYHRDSCVATARCSSARILWSDLSIHTTTRKPRTTTAKPSITTDAIRPFTKKFVVTMTSNTDPRIQKAFNRIQQILDTHVLDQPDQNPLQESAFIEILIRLDELLAVVNKLGKRISFTHDLKLFPNVRDITDTIKACRHAVCHVRGRHQLANATGNPKPEHTPLKPSDYHVEFNAAWGKGVLFETLNFKLESDHNDDIAIFYGAHRLYLKRHIIRAFQEAKAILDA